MGEVKTVRVPFGKKTKFKQEMVITFATVEARDVVRGAAVNLGVHGPEVGMRLEIPNHLRRSMRILQTASFSMKQKNPAAKRNVLFDDESMDLVLDFCLREGEAWRRMNVRQAASATRRLGGRQGAATSTGGMVRDDELEGLFGAEEE